MKEIKSSRPAWTAFRSLALSAKCSAESFFENDYKIINQ